jgi:hypothetical protein
MIMSYWIGCPEGAGISRRIWIGFATWQHRSYCAKLISLRPAEKTAWSWLSRYEIIMTTEWGSASVSIIPWNSDHYHDQVDPVFHKQQGFILYYGRILDRRLLYNVRSKTRVTRWRFPEPRALVSINWSWTYVFVIDPLHLDYGGAVWNSRLRCGCA